MIYDPAEDELPLNSAIMIASFQEENLAAVFSRQFLAFGVWKELLPLLEKTSICG